MKVIQPLILLLLVQLSACQLSIYSDFKTLPSKVLIWPAEQSHWITLRFLARSLASRGHEITVLRPSSFPSLLTDKYDFNFIDFESPGPEPDIMREKIRNYVQTVVLGEEEVSMFRAVFEDLKLFFNVIMKSRPDHCGNLLGNQPLMQKLHAANFSVVIEDIFLPCGELIAAKLEIPFIVTSNLFLADDGFSLAGAPIPLSYVPIFFSGNTGTMTFLQRTKNFLVYVIQYATLQLMARTTIDVIVKKHFGPDLTWRDVLKNTSIWLIRTDFTFEYPRPYTPNMKFVGGYTCKPAKQLSQELEDFISTSEQNGFVVFTLGSMVSSMHMKKANLIASAFSKLKQNVIWRYTGKRPETLGGNTKLMSWVPQNDLLGHPKCKLFITHGGASGIYEGIYHGVPLLGLPLFSDQTDNLLRIQSRGGAISLNPSTLTEEIFLKTMQTLIYNVSYKKNMMQLSRQHRDQPMSPLDSATYWIEYVIRHRGAYHLRPQDRHLYWFQYYLLDVALLFLLIFIAVIFCFKRFICLSCSLCRKVVKRNLYKEKKN